MVGVLSPLEALREYWLDGKGTSKRRRLAHLLLAGLLHRLQIGSCALLFWGKGIGKRNGKAKQRPGYEAEGSYNAYDGKDG